MISKLIVNNIGNFASAEFDFTQGLNVIVGNNGSGKSTILNCIYGAISGDWSRSSSVKQSADKNIHWHAKPDARSGVELRFSNGWVLKRNIRPSSRSLVIPGSGKPVTKDAEIAQHISSMLGISSQVLRDYVMVSQESNRLILDQGESDRMKMIINAFQLERFEKIWESLENESKVDREFLNEPRPDLDALMKELLEAEKEKTELDALPPITVPEVDHISISAEIDRYNKRHTLGAELQQAIEELNKCNDVVTAARTMIAGMEAELDVLRKSYDRDNPDIEAMVRSVADFDKRASEETVLLSMVRSAEGLKARIDSFTMPEKPDLPDVELLRESQRLLADKSVSLAMKAKMSADIRSSHAATCPTCGQSVTSLVDIGAEDEYRRVLEELSSLKKNLEVWSSYEAALAAAQYSLRSMNEEYVRILNSLESARSSMTAVSIDQPTRVLYQRAIDQHRRNKSTIDSRTETLRAAQQALTNDLNDSAKALDRKNSLAAEYSKIPTQNRFMELNRILADLEEAKKKKNDLAIRQSLAEARLSAARAATTLARASINRLEQRREWVQRSSALRELFHRDGIPREILAKRLMSIRESTASYLGYFSASFDPVFTSDMGIEAHFHDGKVMPSTSLSVGQKTVLAMAFRLAMHGVIAPSVDFICLDEPGDGLDDRNRKNLNELFPVLRTISKNNGMQFIIVTHDAVHEDIADNVIRLKDPI